MGARVNALGVVNRGMAAPLRSHGAAEEGGRVAHYLVYWKPEHVNDPNEVLRWAGGAQFAKVRVGDVLWPVSPSPEGYELVTRIEVDRVTSDEQEARDRIGHDLFVRGDAYALGPREGALPNQRTPIT